jgi:flavorubredoxin
MRRETMKALVVYESMFGNTAHIARAIGAGLTERGVVVTISSVDGVVPDDVAGVDLLIVGGPTHAHGLSNDSSRQSAMRDGHNTFDEPTMGPGVRGWMDTLPDGANRAAAAFDTRIGGAPKWLTGSAAKHVAERLDAHGYRLVSEPESFLVTRHNELVDGEVERATTWGSGVASSLRVSP